MNTTQRFARTINEAFPTGTTYAASIERTRRRDRSGQIIIFAVCAAITAGAYLLGWASI